VNFSKHIWAELKVESEKLRRYPGHALNCYIHIESEVCNCGTEEVEEELAAEETKAETQENDSDEREHYDI
jgi:hypothetical protein